MTGPTPVFMLDTNAVSEVLRHPSGPMARRLADLLPGQAVISVVVEGELRYGIARSESEDLNRRFTSLLSIIPVAPLDDVVPKHYGALRAELAAHGQPIGNNDLWIAAHALQLGLTLVTDNESEFRRVPMLPVENWLRS